MFKTLDLERTSNYGNALERLKMKVNKTNADEIKLAWLISISGTPSAY